MVLDVVIGVVLLMKLLRKYMFCQTLKQHAQQSSLCDMIYSYIFCVMQAHQFMSVILARIKETEENVPENEKNVSTEKQYGEEDAVDASKENAANEPEEKEPENKVVLWSQLESWFLRDVGRGIQNYFW